MRIYKTSTFIVTFILFNALQIFAQSEKGCKVPEFNNCFGLEQLILRSISGQVSYYFEDKQTKKEEFVVVSDACVGLFTKNRKLINLTKTNEDGFFQLNKVKDGTYWIVIRDKVNATTPALIKIKVTHKAQENKKIKVHMVILATDSCSYGEIQ